MEDITDKFNEGKKNDTEKLRMDLIPPEIEEELAKALTHGCKEYGDRNWEKGINYNRIYGALRRHLLKWLNGKDMDEDSGIMHLSLALAELCFLLTYEKRSMGKEFDNLRRK